MSSGSRGRYFRGRGRYFRGNRAGRGSGNIRGNLSPQVCSQNSQTRPALRQTTLMECPYKNWHVYFPDDAYMPDSSLDQMIQAFQHFIESLSDGFSQDEIEATGSMKFDFKVLSSNADILEHIPTIHDNLRDNPEKTIQALSLASYQVFLAGYEALSQSPIKPLFEFPQINARVYNYDPLTPLKNLKANCYGKFVAIRGTVVRVSSVKPLVTHMAFLCNVCKETQVLLLSDGKYKLPTKCESDTCRGRIFVPQESSPLTKTIDWQTVKVQEIIDDDQRETGRIPRSIECELTSDLVDSAIPGDVVKICGMVKVCDGEENHRNKEKSMFMLYILANSIENGKDCQTESENSSGIATEFTLKELYAVQEIQAEKNTFQLIVGSFCPSIYGHELVKAGLVLGLFGGCRRYEDDKNNVPIRGNSHVLVVGDPGLGKSQMLKAASNLAPRGIYVCGNTTSAAGLTVTVTKEGGSSGGYALEAGALVQADQGCCCIDEFDKMTSQHAALLEAMEQQSISIAKAGMVCRLPARTSILAAANPAGGHYNLARTVSENLKMGSALLSRFDLVFIILDKLDEEMDSKMSEHVMALHSGKKSPFETVTVRRNTKSEASKEDDDEIQAQWKAEKPLSERLKVIPGHDFDPIPSLLLRKYIAYARQYVHPTLSVEAADELQKFYLDLRQKHHSQPQNTIPITTRQLESLIRLTEARSRLELREEATRQDAVDVIEIMKQSLVDTYTDEMGNIDSERSQNGSGMSRNAQAKRFIAELKRISELEYNALFTVNQMRKIAKDLRLGITEFEDFICSLNNHNYLLKKGARIYQLQTSSYL